jgi:hypothetical protein
MKKLENLKSDKFQSFENDEIANSMKITGGKPVRTQNWTKECYDTCDPETGAKTEVSDWCDNVD